LVPCDIENGTQDSSKYRSDWVHETAMNADRLLDYSHELVDCLVAFCRSSNIVYSSIDEDWWK
jgi:hypothetical protein